MIHATHVMLWKVCGAVNWKEFDCESKLRNLETEMVGPSVPPLLWGREAKVRAFGLKWKT